MNYLNNSILLYVLFILTLLIVVNDIYYKEQLKLFIFIFLIMFIYCFTNNMIIILSLTLLFMCIISILKKWNNIYLKIPKINYHIKIGNYINIERGLHLNTYKELKNDEPIQYIDTNELDSINDINKKWNKSRPIID